eukprot:TRINITY_DN3319_c0_g2_i2.p1 TRINITY_DN3319_c0_g2~~TRINITY_DN3319_c0_g2_i2.p1  ORF type:complete len:181 (-),score=52.22 TRINITY_DN3319_c0_g2_i2:106-648(-)
MLAIHDAAMDGNLEEVDKEIKKNNVSINVKAPGDWTPLHYASINGMDEVVKYLVNNGATVIARTISGWTPLHLAARYSHKETVSFLLHHSANKDSKDNEGKTPYYYTIEKKDFELAKIFETKATLLEQTSHYIARNQKLYGGEEGLKSNLPVELFQLIKEYLSYEEFKVKVQQEGEQKAS